MKAFTYALFFMFTALLQAQTFINSSSYTLSKAKHISFSHKSAYVEKVPIHLLDEKGKKLYTFMISNEHGVSGTEVAVATNTTLLNVKKILKVTLPECACGCEIYTHYFIVTTNDNMIALPEISWTSHEDPEIYWFEYKATSAKRIDLIAYEHDDEAALFKAYKNGIS